MTTRIADIARDDDGNAVAGATVSLRRESDNFQLDSTTTDANGYFTFSVDEVGYPGPVKVVVTDVNGNVRQHSGRSTGQVGTVFMSDFPKAFLMMTDGVVGGASDELEVTSTGLTMNVSVAAGEAFIMGHPSNWESAQDVAITSNASGNPRLDLVVIRLIPMGVSEEGKQTIVAVAGTPAASPVAPSATQDPNVKWEIPLATVRVESGATSIAADKVTDARIYTSGPLQDNSVTTPKLVDDAVTQAKIADAAVGVDQMTAGGELSVTDTVKVLKAPTSGTEPVYAQLAINELSDVAVTTTPSDAQVMSWSTTNSRWEPRSLASTIADVSSNTATSVDSETAVFSGTTGKIIKRGTLTAGVVKSASGVLSAAAASDLPTGIDATKIGAGTVDNAEFGYLNGVTSGIQAQIDAISVGAGTGDVVGPASATSTQLAQFSGTTGKLITNATASYSLVKLSSGIMSAATASDLPSAIDATKIANGSITNTEFQTLNGIGSTAISTQLAGKADDDHTHTHSASIRNNTGRDEVASGLASVTNTVGQVVSGLYADLTLTDGVVYDIIVTGGASVTAPPGGYIYVTAAVDIQSTPVTSTFNGEGTESGSKWHGGSIAHGITGTGGTQRAGLWFKVNTGTGFVGSGNVTIVALPRLVS